MNDGKSVGYLQLAECLWALASCCGILLLPACSSLCELSSSLPPQVSPAHDKWQKKVKPPVLHCNMKVTTCYATLELLFRSDGNYLLHSAPLAVSLGCCRPHGRSGVGGAGAVGVSSVRWGHRGDQRLYHPLQIRARRNGCDGGDEGGTWCCQVSEILWGMRQKGSSVHFLSGVGGSSSAGCLWMKKGVYKKLGGLKISSWCQLWRYTPSEGFPGEWMKLALHFVQYRSMLFHHFSARLYLLLRNLKLFKT